MLKVVRNEVKDRVLRLLTDCWYMNWTLIKPALEMNMEVIGQIPSSRALYALPPEPTVSLTMRSVCVPCSQVHAGVSCWQNNNNYL
ncbi:hypothetical protein [Endozoicomonas sp. SCSIO W0465]|uniref:hypothetical protein n=1 Tax=Endozoicomonas sp. SCSIO W0465 TaxID=2918516 RepID=UPI002074D385|nr:hypothetical protein [Endozoicomonas sp. SCSIO W0465]USE35440.1 hypothetical protein MJO57_25615 [Endozoicomonas sp. SCSIO W0465]